MNVPFALAVAVILSLTGCAALEAGWYYARCGTRTMDCRP